MNDPHVVALLYDFLPEPSVDYSEAEPLNSGEAAFDLTVEDGVARFDLKEHYATEEEARGIVDAFIAKWRLYARLRRPSHAFELRFRRAIIEDRNPIAGAIYLRGGVRSDVRISASLTVGHRHYPAPPPSALAITPDVQSMYDRFVRYLDGKEPLPSMAYFCLTVLEGLPGVAKSPRKAAGQIYRIDKAVLDTIGSLTANKGGTQARKLKGAGEELDANEVRFLRRAVGTIILRMAEMAADPDRDYPTIRMSDL